MRKKGKGVLVLAVLFLCLGVLGAYAEAAMRMAVSDFENNAGAGSEVNDAVRRAITDMLITELAKTPGIQVIERSRIEAIAKEQRLAMSGLVEGSTAVQVGRLLGVEKLITGAITQFSFKQSGGVIPLPIGGFGGVAVGSSTAHVTLDVRLINVETGGIEWTTRASGEADRSMGGVMLAGVAFGQSENGGILSAATYNCIQKVVLALQSRLQMTQTVSSYNVIDVRGANNVLIDAGNVNANTVLGQFFVVFADGAPILGVNNEILGVERMNLAVLKVKEVQARYAVCEVVKGSAAELQRGDQVALLYDSPESVRISSRMMADLKSDSGKGIISDPATLPGGAPSPAPLQTTQPAQPAQTTVPSAPTTPAPQVPQVASAGGIADTSEESNVIDLYPIDANQKNSLKIAHRGGYTNYAKGNFSQAFKMFEHAVNLYPGNYLDAYWAARAAHKMGNKKLMNEWLDKALAVNPNYKPAIDYKAKFGK
ncbi:CsgG/HfaB family protein [Aminiphilus sp.]|uniref:CsgG/HfaB family protein n=1 Tax=Aminiphilus sp. TaxID=1872488 RepID=UPI00261AFE41|nr:CsgG/HfaB family protein [Aminiphilus sp.]